MRLAVLVALGLQGVVWWLIVHYFKTRHVLFGFYDISDIGLYEDYARQFARDLHPYSDVSFEYPPLAAPLMSLARWMAPTEHTEYREMFAGEMIIICAATAAFATAAAARVFRGYMRPLLTAVVFAGATLLAGPLVANRFDVAVALDFAIFCYCVSRRSWLTAAAVLGFGFALKLTPAMLLPLLLLVAARPKKILAAGVVFAVAAFLPFLPHILRSSRAFLYMFKYHGGRPLQIESLYSSWYMLGHVFADRTVVIGNSHGSQGLAMPGTESVAVASFWIMAAGMAVMYALAWLRRRHLRESPSDVSLVTLGLVAVFYCTSKVLSPQFLIWVLPLAALVAGAFRASRCIVGSVVLMAVAATTVVFPARYWDLVNLQKLPILVIAGRNLLLLVTALLVAILLWKKPRRSSRGADTTDADLRPGSVLRP
jgi:hypothetical protein